MQKIRSDIKLDPIMDYYKYIGQKVKVCEGEGCNKRILIKGASPKKYCKECQKIIEKEKVRERVKKHRKNRKNDKCND